MRIQPHVLWPALLALLPARAAPPAQTADPEPGAAAARQFMPGVRINWQARAVEVDGTVVLRDGMLELFACLPQTREHESVIRLAGRARDIYQALGLLGVEPGHPPRWDPVAEQVIPAAGPRLLLEVRYPQGGELRTREIHEWLWNGRDDRPAPPVQWVYSGSILADDGSLAADAEGTVVCVVDFDAALIAMPQSYSADNAALWLRPWAERIPPEGTAVVLIIRPLPDDQRTVRLGRYGRIWYENQPMTRLALALTLEAERQQQTDIRLQVIADPQALSEDLQAIEALAAAAGIPADRVQVLRRPAEPAGPAAELDQVFWMLRQGDAHRQLWDQLRHACATLEQTLQHARDIMDGPAGATLRTLGAAGSSLLNPRSDEPSTAAGDLRPAAPPTAQDDSDEH